LCFAFGIELDEVTSERKMKEKEMKKALAKANKQINQKKLDKELQQYSDEEIYKIDIPANRYDLLCEEGIIRALTIFLQKQKTPQFKISNPKALLVMNVKPEVCISLSL
jgi:phenylalanyl-tRNA synthetase beta chain